MYRTFLPTVVCLALTVPSTGHGQTPTAGPAKPTPAATPASKSLAEMLELALRSNPEVVQAEAKVRQAEADLNQVRLKVTQEVITAYHEGQKQRELLSYYEQEAEAYKRRVATGTASPESASQAYRQLAATRANLAQTEAQLLYILGTRYGTKSAEKAKDVAPTGPASPVPSPIAPSLPPPRIPEEFRKLLEAPITLALDGGQPLGEVFDLLRDITGLNFIVDEEIGMQLEETVRTPLQLSEVTVGKALLALVDRFEMLCFVFRDYGVFVTTPERAATLRSATIPPREELPGAAW